MVHVEERVGCCYLRFSLNLLLLVGHGIGPSWVDHVRGGPAGLLLVPSLVKDDGESLRGGRIVNVPLPKLGQGPTSVLLEVESDNKSTPFKPSIIIKSSTTPVVAEGVYR